ncbi:MAG TPA: ABC transporter permease [Terriglobia bacterium]|nr:ABC transporter permease [Terriglobia bacterium]
MRWIYNWPLRLRSLFRRKRVESELSGELRFHLEKLIEEKVATGMTPEEARYAALRELGGEDQIKEECRDMRRVNYIENFIQDVRYGLRMLAKNPGFTAVAVITLALGIGANTAIFSVVNAVLLRPLPFAAPDQLVSVVSTRRGNVPDNASYPDFADWRAQSHAFSQMAAYDTDNFTLTGRGEAMHIQGAVVSANLFSLLGVKPALGRAFLPGEDKLPAANGAFAIILSHHLWRERFSADPGIVGRTIEIDNRDFTVVGVAPAGFQFPVQGEPVDFWMTMAIAFVTAPGQPSMVDQRGAAYLDVIARLKPRVSRAEARAEMSTIVSRLNKQYPDRAPRGVEVVPEIDRVAGPVRPALLILLAAVASVLLIACANVANLLLARGASRQKEMAVRAALGAGRGRMIRQLLTESVLLAGLGGALGAVLGLWGISGLLSLLPVDIPRLAGMHVDSTVLIFTALVSMLTGILFGLAPATQASKLDFVESLKEGGRGLSNGLHRSRGRGLLVVADVSVAAVLLVAAGLLINSFLRLQRVDPGFNPQHVLTFKMDLPYVRYSGPSQTQFFERAIARLSHVPEVLSASAVLPLPLDGDDVATFLTIEGQPATGANRPRAGYTWVEPGYFRTVGISLIGGRDFAAGDDLTATPVVIINQTLARRFFPHQDPIGKEIKPGIGNGYKTPPVREIVGVVGDVRQYGLSSAPGPEVYVPLAQSPLGSMNFVVRTKVDPLSMVGALRREITEMDKELPFYEVKTFSQYLGQWFAAPRFLTLLLGLFAGSALALAAVGLYGLVSYSVSQRTHEIGVRMALGAEKQDVLRLVVGQGFTLTIIGIAIGNAGSFALTRFLSSLLYGVKPTDPMTFVAVALILTGVALLACYIPARRATKVDPMVALRHE